MIGLGIFAISKDNRTQSVIGWAQIGASDNVVLSVPPIGSIGVPLPRNDRHLEPVENMPETTSR